MKQDHKLLLDGMCGKLARWLRLLGLDVMYLKDVDDENMLSIAETSDRIVITRDQELHSKAIKRGVKSILLTSTEHIKNLGEVLRELKIKITIPPLLTRCPLCNNVLKEVDSVAVAALLPSMNLTSRYKRFWLCDRCNKAYWIGSHWKNIEKILSKVKRYIEEGS
ncbi:MAG: Mut7-C RNAse domain-containing protein [Candidatus Nezhaarchaeota archaeon]|nr:Mut7-C RNAse domain-containing protein [Candidatus Nezhaarchaeota archaeon]MCX8142023.1 Mut7-C RNAse domain-containing protein [Candidatus Nezhaarchaeota archaeon]MDW8050196.1 Mut7-C RNAse domain-containing protein [Nitrososphaerota archaeon]